MLLPRGIPEDFTFDSSFTSAKVLDEIESRTAGVCGRSETQPQGGYEGREQSLQAVARQIPWPAKKPVRVGNRRSWYFSKQRRIPEVQHPVRIVLFWKEREEGQASKALVSNRLTWEVIRMVLVYRHRWTGTETFHRDGKQELGLGRLSGAQRRGADPPRVSAQRSVQSVDAFAPPEPSAGVGSVEC